ncbi:hypothetical protein TNCV_1955041 [Trichonephila clavipes]|nr:hypothetical protein TNCV_1955041 [Trichonephila clavipes]
MVKCRGRHLSWHPPLLTTTPHQREDVSALDRFNVHRCPTRHYALEVDEYFLNVLKSSREVGGRRREIGGPYKQPQGSLPQNWDGIEPNSNVTCMVLKATDNGKRKLLALCQDEFHGPPSDRVPVTHPLTLWESILSGPVLREISTQQRKHACYISSLWSKRSGDFMMSNLQTRIRSSEYCMQNRDSSEKTTLCHSCIQFCRYGLQSHRLSLCCIINGSRSNGHRADSPRYCKRRHTVRADTGYAANMPIS